MFSGIVEATGRVLELSAAPGGGRRLVVDAPFAGELAVGESVAVDGCCLTALPSAQGRLEADLSPQTQALTTLGRLPVGRRVNLERALRVGDRISGHLVQGHVDGVERVESTESSAEGTRLRVSLAASRGTLVAPRGSISIDGVSLTVASLGDGWVEAALVPHTLAVTTLGERRPGDEVNVELDAVAKHVARLAGGRIERCHSGAPWEPVVGYCRALRVGSRILVSGTAPVDEDGRTHAPGDMEGQARRCIEILLRAVRSLGGAEAVVVRTRIFVTDATRWAEVARAHQAAFGGAPPVTTMVEVARLIADDMLVEIEAEAVVPTSFGGLD